MQVETTPQQRLLTIPEAARLLGVSPPWLYDQAARGVFPAVPLGRAGGRGRVWRVRPDDIDAFIDQCQRERPTTEHHLNHEGATDDAS